MKITFGGKPVRPGQLANEVMKHVFKQATDELRERFSAIRHPKTGEFPTVIILGSSVEDFSARVEGSAELLAIVRQRLRPDELEGIELRVTDEPKRPLKVFLSYAGEDRDEARKIAEALIADGIDTWWAEWSLSAGDSIRQKIDEGLADCTHFVVLLTPTSIDKPWVKTEIDAGFVGKVEARCKFIPLRSNLPVERLTPLLRTVVSPSIDDFEKSILQLRSDIHGLTKKPAVGPAPKVDTSHDSYSQAANVVARYFVVNSKTARFGDMQSTIGELATELKLTPEDVRDALHELRMFFRKIEFERAMPKDELYVEFDAHFTEYNPAEDGLKLALDLVNEAGFPTNTDKIAERYGWSARRLNPAISYLFQRALIRDAKVIASGQWVMPRVDVLSDPMRRFVKSRG